MVIYRALYEDGKVYARPYNNFIERVNKGNQEFRFQLQNIKSAVKRLTVCTSRML